MNRYEFTPQGNQKAKDLGLDDLVERVYDEDRYEPFIFKIIENSSIGSMGFGYQDSVESRDEAIKRTLYLLDEDNYAKFLRA